NENGRKIKRRKTKEVLLRSKRDGELFPLNFTPIDGAPIICLLSKAKVDVSWLWHQRFSHLYFNSINKLVQGEHVRGLPILNYDNNHL
ncbi:GAG-pre-integrase domain-containing protein, partial [Bacillus cereus]|uniref:GAG-pre-integrase domain-containing protein n=1 Tax=Bacillus cereus TaxID=1396 RepID=UPI0034D44E4A